MFFCGYEPGALPQAGGGCRAFGAKHSPESCHKWPRKFTSGSCLKITFKTAGFSFRSECDCCFDFPWPVLRCVWAFPAVVRCESSISEADGRLHYSGLTRDLKRGCKCSKTPSLCCGDHQGRMLACQAVVFVAGRPDHIESPPSFHSGVTASLFVPPSEGWR